MKHTITLIPGDGIGPEVTNAVVKILEAAGLRLEGGTPAPGGLAPPHERGPPPRLPPASAPAECRSCTADRAP